MLNALRTKSGFRWACHSLLVICVLLCADTFTFSNAGPNPPLGGLPHLYPKQPAFDCSSITGGDDLCSRCVSQPTCAFCYDSLIPDPADSTKQIVNGLCANYGDVSFTQGCPAKDRFYVPGQCIWPYNQRCVMDTFGRCVIDYMYDDTIANKSNLSLAKGWFIGVLVFFGALFLLSFSRHFSPYYEKYSSYGFDDWEGIYLVGYVVTFSLQLSAIAVNMYSWNNNEDNYYTYGLYGYYISADKYNMHMYSCSSYNTNPLADLTYCRVLPAAVITAAVGAYLSLVWAAFRLILAMTLCCTDRDNASWPPYCILLWRIDFLAAIGSWVNTLVWTSAHLIIKETYIAAPTGAPHDTLHVGKSWILSVVVSFVHIFIVLLYALEVNATRAPYGWKGPQEEEEEAEAKKRAERSAPTHLSSNDISNGSSLKISGPIGVVPSPSPAAVAVVEEKPHVLTPVERENQEIEMAIAASLADKKNPTSGGSSAVIHHRAHFKNVRRSHDDNSSGSEDDDHHNSADHHDTDGKPLSKRTQERPSTDLLAQQLAEALARRHGGAVGPGPDPALAFANDPAVIFAAQQQQQQQAQYGGVVAVMPSYAVMPASGAAVPSYDAPLVPAGAAVSPDVYSSVEASALPVTPSPPVAPVVNFQISQAYHDAHDLHYGNSSNNSDMSLSSGYVPGALLNNNPYGGSSAVTPPAPPAPDAPPVPATPSAPNVGQTDDAPPPYED